jgi:hypothetical protein
VRHALAGRQRCSERKETVPRGLGFPLALALVRVFAADIKTRSLIQYHWCNDPFQKIVFPGNKVDIFR